MEPSRQVWFVSTRGSGVISNVHPPSMSYCFGGDQALIDIVIEIVRRQFHGAASPGSARRQSESRRGSAFTLGAHFRLHQTSSSSARLEKISRSSYPLGMYSYMYRQCGASIHSSHIVHGLCTYMHSSYIVHDSAAETPTASCSALKHRRGAVCSPTSTRAPRPLPLSASACPEAPNLLGPGGIFGRGVVCFPGQKSCFQARSRVFPRSGGRVGRGRRRLATRRCRCGPRHRTTHRPARSWPLQSGLLEIVSGRLLTLRPSHHGVYHEDSSSCSQILHPVALCPCHCRAAPTRRVVELHPLQQAQRTL